MPDIKLYLFGPPRILVDGKSIQIGHRKSISLLAYILVNKQPHTRDALAALFWPEDEPRKALGNLRRSLYRVTHALNENFVTATRNTVELNYQVTIWVDVDEFRERLKAGSKEGLFFHSKDDPCFSRLEEAVELYSGDFMAGFSLPDAPAFDEWQFFQSESLKNSLGEALDWLINCAISESKWEKGISYARRRLALDPYNEGFHRLLMEMYARNNQTSAALRQYEECKRLLNVELGVEPGYEISELYDKIRTREFPLIEGDKDPAAGSIDPAPLKHSIHNNTRNSVAGVTFPGPPHNLPSNTHPFVGRQFEVDELVSLITSNSGHRLITVLGPGGIGKTRLALEVGWRVLRSFIDGVFLVSAAELTSTSDLVRAIADQIGLSFYPGPPAQKLLADYLYDKKMLLILDSFEHLLPEAETLGQLLQKSPGLKILITSRERLSLSVETLYVLGELEYPEDGNHQSLQEYEAIKLLIQTALLVKPNLEFNEQDLQATARICRAVQGMPLAIVLSTGWLTTLSLEEVANEIELGLDFLESQLLDIPERQRSIRAAFEYSWKRLSKEDQDSFMSLSIFVGGFTPQAAQKISGASLRSLRTLIDKSLVVYQQNGRYEIHELLRLFGEERLHARGLATEIRIAHSNNYLEMLINLTPDLKGRKQIAALREIDSEFNNIRAAWDWTLKMRDIKTVAKALEGLYLYCDIRGRQQEGAELILAAKDTFSPVKGRKAKPVYGRILTYSGMLLSRYMRDNSDVGKMIDEGLDILEGSSQTTDLAFGLLARAHYYSDTVQDLLNALENFQASLEIYQQTGDGYYSARALHMIGYCCGFLNGLEDLRHYLEESLVLTQQLGMHADIAMLQISLAMCHFFLDEYTSSKHYGEEAIRMAKDIGPGPTLAQTNAILGLIYLVEGNFEEANKFIENGYILAKRVSFPIPLAYSICLKGALLSLKGEPEEGRKLIENCLTFPVDPLAPALFYWAAAVASCSVGDFTAAIKEIQAVFSIHERIKIPGILNLCLPVVSLLLDGLGQTEKADEVLSILDTHIGTVQGWTEKWLPMQDLQAKRLDRQDRVANLQTGEFEEIYNLENWILRMLVPLNNLVSP